MKTISKWSKCSFFFSFFSFIHWCRLGLYKKAIIDVDFVLQKLDEKNIRAWLYRAKSYYLLDERRDFEKSVNEAKKNNPKHLDLIEKTVASILENKMH